MQRRDHEHVRGQLAGRQREAVRQRDHGQPAERVLVGLPAASAAYSAPLRSTELISCSAPDVPNGERPPMNQTTACSA